MSEVEPVVDMNRLDELIDEDIPVIYEAKYFASDDDYLMRADIREFFKANSVGEQDYMLFQLNRAPYEGMVLRGPDGAPLFRNSMALGRRPGLRPGARHLWGLLDSGEHQSMINWFKTGWLTPLGYWLLVLTVTGVAVFLGLMYLPLSLNFLLFGGLLVVFIFIMVLFVDWNGYPLN